MVCQGILSVSQTVLASLPPKLAAVWFGPNQVSVMHLNFVFFFCTIQFIFEVSTACALGLFGTQLGVALGFILPPMLVKNHEDTAKIGDDLYFLTWLLSGFMIPVAIAIVICTFLPKFNAFRVIKSFTSRFSQPTATTSKSSSA